MSRSYWQCHKCSWQIVWAFVPPKPDPDMGLVIAGHVETCHPEMIYGPLIPAYLGKRLLELTR